MLLLLMRRFERLGKGVMKSIPSVSMVCVDDDDEEGEERGATTHVCSHDPECAGESMAHFRSTGVAGRGLSLTTGSHDVVIAFCASLFLKSKMTLI